MDFATWWKYASPNTRRKLLLAIGRSRAYAQYLRNGKPPSQVTMLKIEAFTDGTVNRHDLRPDLYSLVGCQCQWCLLKKTGLPAAAEGTM